jgi:HEAT repeat protein
VKIELFGNYPDEVKDYVKEYNMGVDNRDVNIVGTAVNSLVTLVFTPDDELKRQAAIHALDQIGNVQPGFLKSAAKTLMIRFQGGDEGKKLFAGAALDAIFIGKKAEKLIDDPNVLQAVKAQRSERETKQAEVKAQEAKVLQEIQQLPQLDLTLAGAIPELKPIGQYFNTCLLNNQEDEALKTGIDLMNKLLVWRKSDRRIFSPGCILLGQMGAKNVRRAFTPKIYAELAKIYYSGQKEQKEAAAEIMDSIFTEIADLLPQDLFAGIQADVTKRLGDRQAEKSKQQERAAIIAKLKVPVSVGWDSSVQTIATDYNRAVVEDKDEFLKKSRTALMKSLTINDARVRKSISELIGILVNKNPEFIKDIVAAMLNKYTEPGNSEILGLIVDDLEKLGWADAAVLVEIKSAKKQRLAEDEARRQKRQEEYDKLEQITIKLDGDWHKEVTKYVEALNEYLLKPDLKNANKLTANELKKLLFAKDEDIRRESHQVFGRIAQKYPDLLDEPLKELVPLYLSTHEQRPLAVDPFGTLFDLGLAESIFKEKYPEVLQTLATDWANRKQEIENLELQKKWDAIKADVTQLRVNDNWSKNMQTIARDYNTGIKEKKMEQVLACVKKVVDIVMNEKKDELQLEGIQVLGLIANKNIELIQPTINLFLELLEGKDMDKKSRAIKGLGEVTRQRPGWAYFGIEKLMHICLNDPSEDFRIKAMQEIERIAAKDPVMIVEHVDNIIKCLSADKNKHVRRLAAMTLGNMAEAIPLEAEQAIPALSDALHDEFILVRKFADKALSLIREAIRKSGNA